MLTVSPLFWSCSDSHRHIPTTVKDLRYTRYILTAGKDLYDLKTGKAMQDDSRSGRRVPPSHLLELLRLAAHGPVRRSRDAFSPPVQNQDAPRYFCYRHDGNAQKRAAVLVLTCTSRRRGYRQKQKQITTRYEHTYGIE